MIERKIYDNPYDYHNRKIKELIRYQHKLPNERPIITPLKNFSLPYNNQELSYIREQINKQNDILKIRQEIILNNKQKNLQITQELNKIKVNEEIKSLRNNNSDEIIKPSKIKKLKKKWQLKNLYIFLLYMNISF